MMTIFQDLGREFDGWRQRYFDDQSKSMSFVMRVAEGFRNYIGAPEDFKEPRGREKHRYIIPTGARDNGDGTFTCLPDENSGPFDLLTRWEDGYYHVAITVAVEIGPNVWPKQKFAIPLSFVIADGDVCKVRVTNKPEGKFDFPMDEIDKQDAMYAFMVSVLSRIFEAKPSDMVEKQMDAAERRDQMGFLAHLAKERDQ